MVGRLEYMNSGDNFKKGYKTKDKKIELTHG